MRSRLRYLAYRLFAHGRFQAALAKAGMPYYLDPAFAAGMRMIRKKITGMEVVKSPLADLRCVVAAEDGRWQPARIEETPAYGFLQGDVERYVAYVRRSSHVTHGIRAFRSLERSMLARGYPYDGRHMVVFGDEPYLRDGQHRAALL